MTTRNTIRSKTVIEKRPSNCAQVIGDNYLQEKAGVFAARNNMVSTPVTLANTTFDKSNKEL